MPNLTYLSLLTTPIGMVFHLGSRLYQWNDEVKGLVPRAGRMWGVSVLWRPAPKELRYRYTRFWHVGNYDPRDPELEVGKWGMYQG